MGIRVPKSWCGVLFGALLLLMSACGDGSAYSSAPPATAPPSSQPTASEPESTTATTGVEPLTRATGKIDMCPVRSLGPCSAFKTPSGNISCFATSDGGGVVRCDIASGLVPTPSRACELDWTGMTARAQGDAAPACASDALPTAGNDVPVIEYGTVWSRFGLRCVSRETGLRCANAAGHGFSLSRERWSAF